jgi:hypothetical protein
MFVLAGLCAEINGVGLFSAVWQILLATIDGTVDRNTWTGHWLLQVINLDFWVGVFRLTNGANMTFANGTAAPPSGQPWCPGEPNNAGGTENCALMMRDRSPKCMNDLICTFGHYASAMCSLSGGCGRWPSLAL